MIVTQEILDRETKVKTFITHKGQKAGPDIEACDHQHAEALAMGIDTDLVVDGELRLMIMSDTMTEAKADAIIKAIAYE
ncbi:hypothetical protein LCGC14_2132530 [marine sediment metagenome]|uniref:Uncharacterized protein n=1 Tax=marine sediment metagenome TaxID=412755 RepID=A0A0F9GDX9_9ZZZZ